MFPCESGLSLLVVAGLGASTSPISLLVSGHEPNQNLSSNYHGLPAVHVVDILSGEIAEQIEQVVSSARYQWEITDVMLVLIVPVLLLMVVLALARLMPLKGARVWSYLENVRV